jgi:hypothetical protein
VTPPLRPGARTVAIVSISHGLLGPGDTAEFYFAGHGVEFAGRDTSYRTASSGA